MLLNRRFALVASLALASSAHADKCPNVMFVLDRSGSMDEDPSGGSSTPTKWNLLQAAVKSVVTTYGAQIPFGMEMFTSSGGDDASCYMETMISVEPAHGTAASIISTINAAMPDSGTNTAQAIRRARNDTAMHDPTRGQYLVLITDGDPNCPFNDDTGAPYTVKEITAATNQSPSIDTFVIGFDGTSGVNPDNLNKMANAGKQPVTGCPGTKCYYSATSAQKLNDAINAIVNKAMGGEFGTTMCDDSCYSSGCPSGQVCVTDEINPTPHCASDPCAGVSASCQANGDFCRDGQCVHACLSACATGQMCQDGNCVADPCAGASCSMGQACDPKSGKCVQNLCLSKNVTCPGGSVCDAASGTCVFDECRIVNCPMGTVCVNNGNCQSTTTMMGGGGGGNGGRASVGCSVATDRESGALAAIAFAGLALLLAIRRRKRA